MARIPKVKFLLHALSYFVSILLLAAVLIGPIYRQWNYDKGWEYHPILDGPHGNGTDSDHDPTSSSSSARLLSETLSESLEGVRRALRAGGGGGGDDEEKEVIVRHYDQVWNQ